MSIVQRAKSPLWLFARVAAAGTARGGFLNSAWPEQLLARTPSSHRGRVALRILGLSPHYFYSPGTARYPAGVSRRVALTLEDARMRGSREQVTQKLLARWLSSEDTVLDYGCGAGYLSKAMSFHVKKVTGCDLARGAVACARELNTAPNVEYRVNDGASMPFLDDESVDAVVCLAVIEHLNTSQTEAVLREFRRVLRPGGRAIVHVVIRVDGDTAAPITGRFRLPYHPLTEDQLADALTRHGFQAADLQPVSKLADIHDDIGRQHVVTFVAPRVAT